MYALLVDADARAAFAIRLMLESGDIVTDWVGSARHAVERAQRCRYDVLLVDLILPDMSGCQLVRYLRSAGFRSPILVLSRLAQTQARTVALEAGADGFLSKPFERRELLSRIRLLLPQGERPGHPAAVQSGTLPSGVVVPLSAPHPAHRRIREMHATPTASLRRLSALGGAWDGLPEKVSGQCLIP